MPGSRTRTRRIVLEALEPRQMLAVTAVGDVYRVDAGTTLQVDGQVAGYMGSGLEQVQTIDAVGSAVQIEYSSQYQWLIVRTATTIQLVDERNSQLIGSRQATWSFTDMDLTPDGRYLFVADYAFNKVNYVHRLDLATLSWETKAVPDVAFKVEAVDRDRFFALESDQHVDVTLNDFGSFPSGVVAELSRTLRVGYTGDFEYDFRSGRLFHGNHNLSSDEISAFQLKDNALINKTNTGGYGSAQDYGGSVALASDGTRLYYGKLQVEAADIRNSLRVFPEVIWAATPQFAFGRNGYYDASTGVLLGDLGFATSVYFVSDDGADIWAFDDAGDLLHHYRPTDLRTGVLVNDAGQGGLAASLATAPEHGNLTLRSDGSFTYAPAAGYSGVDSFTYVARDAAGEEATARVTLIVRPTSSMLVATNDDYTTTAGTPLVVDDSINYDLPELVKVEQLASLGNVTQMVYAEAANLLIVRSDNVVRVIDLALRMEVQSHAARMTYTDMDLSPDGQFLFVADFGGTTSGSDPARPSYVHRLNLVTLTWEEKVAPAVAYRLEAVDSQRFLLLDYDLMLNDFGASPANGIAELSRTRAYAGDFDYDSATRRVYFGNTGLSSQEIKVFEVVGNSLMNRGGTGSYGTAQGFGGTYVLSADGSRFYYGRLQVDAQNINTNRNVFAEGIRAAASKLAFGTTTYFDARTAEARGVWGFSATVISVSADGDDVWAFDPDDDVLHHYRIVPVARLGVLVNDRDPSGDVLTAELASPAAHGTVDFHADGTFTYTPEDGFAGLDQFSYTTTNSSGQLSPAQVTINVLPAPVVNAPPQAVDDVYHVTKGGVLTVGAQPWSAVPNFEVLSLPTLLNIRQLEYSPQFDLVFARTNQEIRIFAGSTGAQIETLVASNFFSDMDLTFDGRYLFAADYGGETTGYGQPIQPHYVHRYDLATRTWDVQSTARIAYRLEAVDRNHVLLREADQHVDLTYNYFSDWPDSPIKELARISGGYRGDFEYDPRTQTIYHGSTGSSSHEIRTTKLVDGAFVPGTSSGVYGTAQGYEGTSVLSSDGKRFYYGQLQVEALDVRNNLNDFSQSIMAASGQVAFGKSAYFDAKTGNLLGTFAFEATAWFVSDDGAHAWAADTVGKLHHFVLSTGPQGLLLNDLDANGDMLQVAAVGQPLHGIISYDASGAFVYRPSANYVGPDQFSYRVTDPSGAQSVATVRISVDDHRPTDLQLDRNVIHDRVMGASVARISVTTTDTGSSFSFTVSDGRFEVVDGMLRLKEDVGLSAAQEPSLTLSITAVNARGESIAKSFTFQVVSNANPWLNHFQQFDVSDDGEVTPLDALLIVNELNFGGPRTLAALSGGASVAYLDPSGDGEVTPLDALIVINFLNAGAHAEPAPQAANAAPRVQDRSDPVAAAEVEQASAADLALAWYWHESQTAVGKQDVDSSESAAHDLIEALLSVADQTR